MGLLPAWSAWAQTPFFGNSPESGDTYEFDEWIQVRVRASFLTYYSSRLPKLKLIVGEQTRLATMSDPGPYFDRYLNFWYRVRAEDRDSDGVSIPANAFIHNGASGLPSSHPAVPDSPRRKVDGSRFTIPSVDSIEFYSNPDNDDTYERGEAITVRVEFNGKVVVTGSARLALIVGKRTRYALHKRRTVGSTAYFRYTVQAADLDTDGVGIPANAIALNGGTIKAVADGSTDAVLGHDAVADDASHKVDGGGPYTPPAVNEVRFASVPANGDAYERDEEIRVQVGFNRGIAVTGTPRLALTIGAYTRQAAFSTASGSSVFFTYTVRATDIDADGASIAAGALTLNDGTIRDVDDNDADPDLGSHAIVDDARHKVAGTLPPAKSRAVVVGDELAFDLPRLFAVADADATYTATSSSDAVTIRIENGTLIVTPNEGTEGSVVTVTVTVVHVDGTRQTLRFPVTVEPAGRGFWRGWRLALVEKASPNGGLTVVTDNSDEAFAPADEAAFNDRVVGKRIETDDPENYVDIVEPGRFEETEGADNYVGSYSYEKTGPNTGTVTWSYDDGDRCTSTLTFASETSGTTAYECDDGSSGESGWRLVEIPQSPSEDTYVRLDDLTVSPGRVRFFVFSAGRCIAISNATINGVTYAIKSSKWQKRENSNSTWADIPNTEEEGQLCSLNPSERGEYRLVAEITIDGETGMYASNVMVIE